MGEKVEVLVPTNESNREAVERIRGEHPELEDSIPEHCRECITAWFHAFRGHSDILKFCDGFHATPDAARVLGQAALPTCTIPRIRDVNLLIIHSSGSLKSREKTLQVA